MKKAAFFIIVFLLFSTRCFPQTKELQFRSVLTGEESKTIAYDKYADENGKEISVNKQVLLSDKDIEQIGISKDEFGRPMAVAGFTDSGKKKYFEWSKVNIRRQLARIYAGKFLAAPYINEAQDTGFAAIPVASLSDAEALIKGLGFAPYLQRGINNAEDAKTSYGYAKYAMENGRQEIARKISLQLYRYNPKSEFFMKLIKDYPSLDINNAGQNKIGEDCCSGHRGVCGDKCCDGVSILSACEELYRDATYFARPEPPKRDITLPGPSNSVIGGTETRVNVVTGTESPKQVITGPEESSRSSVWPVSPPRKKVKSITQGASG